MQKERTHLGGIPKANYCRVSTNVVCERPTRCLGLNQLWGGDITGVLRIVHLECPSVCETPGILLESFQRDLKPT